MKVGKCTVNGAVFAMAAVLIIAPSLGVVISYHLCKSYLALESQRVGESLAWVIGVVIGLPAAIAGIWFLRKRKPKCIVSEEVS
jgi:hypothetical protein